MLARIRREWLEKPFAATVPTIMVLTGIVSVLLGDQASKAFSNFGGATLVRVMGAVMFMGGILVIFALTRKDPVLELIGLSACAFGATIYGIGVILGLHTQGLIAGLGYLSIAGAALGCILQITTTHTTAQRAR